MSTREELETELNDCMTERAMWINARKSLATGGASYSIKDGDSYRQLTRVNLTEIQTVIDRLTARINEITYQLSNPSLKKRRKVIFMRGC